MLLAGCGVRSVTPLVDLKSGNPSAILNLAWLDYRRDFGGPAAWEDKGVSSRREEVGRRFAELHDAGVKGVVWFLLADGGGAIRFDTDGRIIGLAASFLADFKAGLAIAEQNQMAVVWVLLDHLWMKPAEFSDGAKLFGHARLIEDVIEQKIFFERVLDPIIAAGSASAATVGWIVMNEPEVALGEGWVTEEQLFPFLVAASRRIKTKYPTSLVSIGHADYEAMIYFQREHSGAVDFLTFHHYRDYLPPTKPEGELPVYVGEFNVTDSALGRISADMKTAVTSTRALGYAGAWPWGLKDIAQIREFVAAQSVSVTKVIGQGPPARQIELWGSEIKTHLSHIELNGQKLRDTQQLLATLEPELAKQEAETQRAQAAFDQLQKSLAESRIKIIRMKRAPWANQSLRLEEENEKQLTEPMETPKGPRQWLKEASAVQKKTQLEIVTQRAWIAKYEMHIRGNRYQIKAKQRAIGLSAEQP